MSEMMVTTVRVPRDQWFELDQMARRIGMSRNALLNLLVTTADEDAISRALMRSARLRVAQLNLDDAEDDDDE
jgi:predicted DNA-binding ribbon-helix-helix protein